MASGYLRAPGHAWTSPGRARLTRTWVSGHVEARLTGPIAGGRLAPTAPDHPGARPPRRHRPARRGPRRRRCAPRLGPRRCGPPMPASDVGVLDGHFAELLRPAPTGARSRLSGGHEAALRRAGPRARELPGHRTAAGQACSRQRLHAVVYTSLSRPRGRCTGQPGDDQRRRHAPCAPRRGSPAAPSRGAWPRCGRPCPRWA